jgi:hypothetical protein
MGTAVPNYRVSSDAAVVSALLCAVCLDVNLHSRFGEICSNQRRSGPYIARLLPERSHGSILTLGQFTANPFRGEDRCIGLRQCGRVFAVPASSRYRAVDNGTSVADFGLHPGVRAHWPP